MERFPALLKRPHNALTDNVLHGHEEHGQESHRSSCTQYVSRNGTLLSRRSCTSAHIPRGVCRQRQLSHLRPPSRTPCHILHPIVLAVFRLDLETRSRSRKLSIHIYVRCKCCITSGMADYAPNLNEYLARQDILRCQKTTEHHLV